MLIDYSIIVELKAIRKIYIREKSFFGYLPMGYNIAFDEFDIPVDKVRVTKEQVVVWFSSDKLTEKQLLAEGFREC